MAGGMLQLIAYGAQDIFLTNNPQITFFKAVYRRHTNFSIQTFEKTFNDSPDFGKKSSVQVFRLGDLATRMYLRVVLNGLSDVNVNAKYAWIRRVGHAMIREIEIMIGGVILDKQYGTWLDIWYELARQGHHARGYAKLIGDVNELTEYNAKPKPMYVLQIPLKFWFNRHYSLALPLIAIQYHQIFINVYLEEKTKLLVRNSSFTNFADVKILEMGLMTDYVYLDIPERRRFASVAHEYLIEQVQFNKEDNLINPIKRTRLDFNYPTKEIIWAMKNGNYTTGKIFVCYTNEDDWTAHLLMCSEEILRESMILLRGPQFIFDQSGRKIITIPGEPPPAFGVWEEFEMGVIDMPSSNGNIIVTNRSKINSLWINVNSLVIFDETITTNGGNYSLTDKIGATVLVTESDAIVIQNVTSSITDRDASFPLERMIDTRISSKDDVQVYQFNNYGLFITGKINPVDYALLEYNGIERFRKRNGKFFGTLQPYMHHSNTPADGINLYSFAIRPEEHQPTGTSNLSRIENVYLTVGFADPTYIPGVLPRLNLFNLDNRFFVFGFSYNIFRVISGLTGLAYNG